jgi:hypothetical protein
MRTHGSKNVKLSQVVKASRCVRPECGSSERGVYQNTDVRRGDGIYQGEPYTHCIRRRTQCLSCGEWRIDIAYENRVPRKPNPKLLELQTT